MVDIGLVAIGLPLLAPTMTVAAAGLRLSTGLSPIFRQNRAGRNGRPFTIMKLRTMTDARGADGRLLPDRLRLTSFGKAVRALSIDELPQLLNVLRGDMSLVGPRPLPLEYQSLYTDRERTRLRVAPGITGWAQINGRHRTMFDQRLEYDAWYVEHLSFRLDLKIMMLTVLRVARRTDVVLGQEIEAVDDRGFAGLWRKFQADVDPSLKGAGRRE